MYDNDGQDGLTPAAAETEISAETGTPGEAPDALTADVLLAEAVLDGEQDAGLPELPELAGNGDIDPELAVLFDAPPIEVAAGPGGAGSGGGSSYSSDFGQLIAGLRASGVAPGVENAATFGAAPLGTSSDDDSLLILPSSTSAPTVVDSEEGGSNDDSIGGADDSTVSGGEEGGEEGEPAGPGADQGLFTNQADVVDFNDIDAGGYLDGTQYDALNQHDTVVLPGDADEAAEAGFDPGTWFHGNNGHDHITGGNLADLIDGGNGRDTLLGGGGNDSLIGGNGRDTLLGGGGNDSLIGGNGRDSLDGGAGDDTLLGGNGNDTLTGGAGDDVMSGGSGKDVFAFSLAADEGNDLILDFATGKGGDSLQISDLIDINGDGDIDVADLDAGGHSVTSTADSVIITFDTGTTVTLENVSGTGVSSFDDLLDMKVNIDIV